MKNNKGYYVKNSWIKKQYVAKHYVTSKRNFKDMFLSVYFKWSCTFNRMNFIQSKYSSVNFHKPGISL